MSMSRRRGTNTSGRRFSDDVVEQVWEKARPIRGKAPGLYRKDAADNVIYRPSYGKDSEMGWQIDHKNPVSKGGTDHGRNLQPLQSEENKEKGNEYPWTP
jgi:hypothetical protein